MANIVTLARLPLLGVILFMIYFGSTTLRFVSVALILILILMDSLDGFVARRYGETSLLGSALDIAADRVVEIVLWVFFAYLGLISIVIPILVIARGTLTDSIRGVASSHGVRPFDMMRSRLGRLLVAERGMRTAYGATKGFAFCALALAYALRSLWGTMPPEGLTYTAWLIIHYLAQAASWLALALCLLRGIPVLIEAPGYFRTLHKGEQS